MASRIISAEVAREIKTNSQEDSVAQTLRMIEKRIRESAEMGYSQVIIIETFNPQINSILINAGYTVRIQILSDNLLGVRLPFTRITF